MKTLLCTVILSLTLAGCQSPSVAPTPTASKEPVRIPWPEDEYAKIEKKGKNTVSGQAFLKTRGGDVKTAAGELVTLTPATSYSKDLVNLLKFLGTVDAGRDSYPEIDARFHQFTKETTADASGKFTFYDVAPGDYYIYTHVTWEAPSSYGLSRQGGLVSKQVSIKDDERNEVIITDS